MDVLEEAGLAFRALQYKDQIEELVNILMPYFKMAKRDFPEVSSKIAFLVAELFPETQQAIANKNGVITFDVKWFQEALNKVKASQVPLTVDGDYGESTKQAVKHYQVSKGLVPDGWIGLKTFKELFMDVNK